VLSTVEVYDPAANTWSTKAPMPTPRYLHAAAVVNGVLYAIGGHNNASVLDVFEAYDPATNSWTTMPPMPTARSTPAVGVVNCAALGCALSGWCHRRGVCRVRQQRQQQ